MGAVKGLCLFIGWSMLLLSGVASAQNAETTQPADVYAGPDDSYPVVAQLDADAPVQVMGCLEDWSWCDVVVGDSRGWLYSPVISYGYEGGYVPFYAYAPSFGVPVVQFTIGDYWDHYYHGRPWYAHREEWIHRPPPHRHRPSGPPPSAGPPPRSAGLDYPRDARPTREARPAREALAPREAPPPRERIASHDRSPPHVEHAPQPPQNAETQHHEGPPRPEGPPRREEPQRREEPPKS